MWRPGRIDLAWVAPRPWHAKGVMSFDALMAPLLVDSYALQQAVLESDLEQAMLAGLEGTGLVGLGVLPGPLRRVAMAEGGFRAAGDLRGKLVGIQESEIATMTFEALGATTKSLPSGAVLGGEDAVEQQLESLAGNRYYKGLPHVTVDLALWPRPVILFANEARFDNLSSEQQSALRGVTKQILRSTTEVVESEDASALATLCSDGADIVVAGDDAKSGMLTAVRPVYDELKKDAATASMMRADRGDEGRDPDLDIDHHVPEPVAFTRPADRRRISGGHLRSANSRAPSSRPIGRPIRNCPSRTGPPVRS